jgi:predicted kinase
MYGVSGSGKSWLSGQIIDHCQGIRLRSDIERKRIHKLSAQQKSHSGLDSGLYNKTSSDKTYQHLLQLAIEIVNSGYSVIVDATFLQQQQRKLFSQQAEKLHIPFLIVHTQTDKQTLSKRIKARVKQQDNVSEADQMVLENQFHNMQPLTNKELKFSITIDTDQTAQLAKLWKLLDNQCHTC